MAYNANSIQVRSFREAARATPSMYLGDDKQNGIFNGFLEILNNSCDEAIMGRGACITVELSDDCDTITVIDEGRGVPHGPNQDCPEVLIELFTQSHTSGKFDEKNYKKARGLHGIGASAICVCSKRFEVWTRRDGYEWYMDFVDGQAQTNEAVRLEPTSSTGTTIRFTPDKTLFHLGETEKSFEPDEVARELELTSYFIPKVKFTFVFGGKTQTYFSENGIKDFAQSRITNALHKNYIYGYREFDDEVEVEVFAQWTSGHEQSYVFSNGALNSEGGTPIAGAKAAFTRTINNLAKADFDSDSIRKGLVYIINIKHPHPIYQNQVKNKIQNSELRGYTQTVFTEAIKDFAYRNKGEFDKIVEVLKKEQRAEIAAEKARRQVLEATRDIERNQKRKVFASDKLKDAEFLGQDSTLLLVEGLSAASSIAMARDSKCYGILALRGKLINAMANPEEKFYQNEEIKLLLSAMNISPNHYDPTKLRYGRLGILCDADADGYAIGLLIMCALYKVAPQFIEEGRLYWMRSPLFIVSSKGKESYYYTDEEFNKVRGKVAGTVQRAKGLGSLSADQAHRAMFTPEFQRLEQLVPSDDTYPLLCSLMGADSQPKHDFIFANIDFSEIKE